MLFYLKSNSIVRCKQFQNAERLTYLCRENLRQLSFMMLSTGVELGYDEVDINSGELVCNLLSFIQPLSLFFIFNFRFLLIYQSLIINHVSYHVNTCFSHVTVEKISLFFSVFFSLSLYKVWIWR